MRRSRLVLQSHNVHHCDNLTSVTIGSSVQSIGESAFLRSSAISTITCLAEIAPYVGEYAFYEVSKMIPIYVPCEALEAYQAHEQWGQFTNIQCIASEETDTEDVIIESGTTTIQKIMRDGQFIILRDGVEYNAMGQEL